MNDAGMRATSARRPARIVFCVQNESVPRDRRVWLEAISLAALGHQVVVVCPRDRGQKSVEMIDGIEVRRYPAPHSMSGIAGNLVEYLFAICWTSLYCLRIARKGPIDTLHAANPPDIFFTLALLLRPWRTRFVFDQHDICPELAQVKWGQHRLVDSLLRHLERWSYRTADLVIVPNNSYRQIAIRRGGLDPSRVVVVRNGPASAERKGTPPPLPPLRAVVAGVLGRHDGVGLVLKAAALLEARRPGSIRVDIIGTGEAMELLQADASRLGVSGLVTWAGWLSGDAYERRLHSAHVGVSPDPDDPFSRASTMMKVAEYVAGGMPCVVADLPENHVSAGDAALYFTPGDAVSLAQRLEELVDAPERLAQLSKLASRRGPGLLWNHSAERLQSSYRWLLGGGPPVAGEQVVAS
jgi:glycosyltransferase involved in cell wall biosynthesis